MNEQKIPYFGIWAESMESYMQAEKLKEYNKMQERGELIPYLAEVQETYSRKASTLEAQLMMRENVTEDLKARDPMEWVGQVNNIRQRVREILQAEMQVQ